MIRKCQQPQRPILSAYYGFDKPLLQQYLTYLNNLIHGNFGFSTKYPSRTVNDLLAGAFPYSADLGILRIMFCDFLWSCIWYYFCIKPWQ